MARKSNTTVKSNGKEYKYTRITRKVGVRKNKRGEWVSEYKQFTGRSLKECLEKYEAYMNASSWDGLRYFGECVDHYINTVFMPHDDLKQATKIKYCNDFERVFGGSPLLKRELSEVNGLDIQKAINESDSGATTIKQAVNLLKRFYKYCDSMHVCRNITGSLVLPKIEHKAESQDIEVFSDSELKTLLDNIPEDHRLRFLIILAANTGCRIGELLALTYDDITDGQLTINKTLTEIEKKKGSEDSKTRFVVETPKTKASVRTIPLSDKVLKEFRKHKLWHQKEMLKRGYRTPYLFTTVSGGFIYRRNAERSLKRLCASESIKITPRGWHVFRHTFASKLARNGAPITTVQKLLGHTSINITAQYYINVDADEKRAAINALAL